MTANQSSLELSRKVTECIQNQQWHQAKYHCQQLLVLDPHDAQVHQLLGLIHIQLAGLTPSVAKRNDHISNAVGAFEAATAHNSGMFEAYLNLGNAYLQAHRAADGLRAFQSAQALNPEADLVYANQAEAHRQLGDSAQALSNLELAIQLAPQKPGYLVKIGNLLRELGRHEEAIACYDQAIQIEPNQAEAYAHMAISMEELGHHDAAMGCCNIALEIDPTESTAHYHRALFQIKHNETEAALASLNSSLELQPNSIAAWLSKGSVLIKQKEYSASLTAFDRAIELGCSTADVFQHRATCHIELDQLDAAINDLEEALNIDPKHATSLMTLGVVSQKLGRFEAAIQFYTQAIEQDPKRVEAYSNLGAVLFECKRFEDARITLEAAIEIDPQLVNGWSNLGATLMELYHFKEAEAAFDRVLSLAPTHVDAYCHKGLVLHNLNRMEEALSCYEKALTLDSSSTLAHWNKAIGLLLSGDFRQGWAQYEARWAHKKNNLNLRNYPQPRLTAGTNVKGKRLFIYQEQGLGDTLMFARFIPKLIDRGAQVCFEVQPGLVQILSRCLPQAQVIEMGQASPLFDFHSPLLSLAEVFEVTEKSIPNSERYLFASTTKVNHWQQLLGAKTRPRIGLVWSGNSNHQNDRNRSIPLKVLAQALPEGFDYISLQNQLRTEDADTLKHIAHIKCYAEELRDFEDTAALCECLDLIVSVDTSVAHLSAALGKNTWTLIPYSPDWRWMKCRMDTPWYKSMQLIRQKAPGCWKEPLVIVKAKLIELLDKNSTPITYREIITSE